MTISYNWLQQYLPKTLTVAELSHILTSIGLEVEGTELVEAVKGGLRGLVIGEVLTCEQHPNADKLKKTTVNVGGDRALSIVCGAANVAAGQKVVVATVGCQVHPINGEAFEIKKAKIRGEESEGMICAEDEIGLGTSHDGIMVLPAEAKVGTLATAYFSIADADTAIHIGLTPNRSDAMSHIGVARDVCAYLSHHEGKQYAVVMPELKADFAKNNSKPIAISIAANAQEACARYAGISLGNIKVGPSPDWLKRALEAIGVRAINNIVDITNYVLHEYGQPLHAFDAAKIVGNKIEVKCLAEATKFTTLDSKERALYAEDLMICNAEKGMCIAGVFGGADSGVSDTTTSIFLESAYFNSASVRCTSLRHGLRTDAATHFEKCVDINNVIPALKRAADLMVEIAGAEIVSAVQDIYPKALPSVSVTATYKYIQNLSGKLYTPAVIKGILSALQFEYVSETEEGFTVKVPTNKNDVSLAADLVEEVLRIDGLDQIAIPSRLNISLLKPLENDRAQREKIATILCGIGFQEIVTNSITNSKYYPEETPVVRMINSLTSELDVLRPSMLQSGLEVVHYNINRKNQSLSLFEFGNTYSTKAVGEYNEQPILALWLTGAVRAASWSQKEESANLFYVKSVVENMLQVSGIAKVVVHVDAEGLIHWKWKNESLATAYKLTTEKAKQFDIKQDVYYAEINWALWYKAMGSVKVTYSEVPKYPAVQRDLALVLDKTIPYQEVQKWTKQAQINAMKSYDLFDVFESEKLGADKKSYAMNYTFQLADRTLTDSEIEGFMKQLTDIYTNKLNAQIRS
ncbi:MAG: phenylalanine--tRNA ligase subunit beta [Chitinophagaceae bacterium]|nr:phenylalanine--tRNA ligase subunit beta [Chitinophagaceae bacterium]